MAGGGQCTAIFFGIVANPLYDFLNQIALLFGERYVFRNLDDLLYLAACIQNGKIFCIQKKRDSAFRAAFKDTVLRPSLREISPKLLVLGTLRVGRETEDAVVLSDNLCFLISYSMQKVFIGILDDAAGGENDQRTRSVQALPDLLQHRITGHLY
ncbi:MAG: hypothetical protein PHO57_05100 [Acidithiobacillus sp.]|nr:hypothetical protein [Acidithiobacillus sp.]